MTYFKSRSRLALEQLASNKQQKIYSGLPEQWMVNKFGEPLESFKWSAYPEYANHIWDGTPDPFLNAIEALGKREWVSIQAATSVGKTYILPKIIYWFLDTFPNSLVITTAPKRDQLRRVLWSEMANSFPKFQRIRTYAQFLTLNVRVDKRAIDNLNTKVNKGYIEANMELGHEAIGFVAGVGSGEESATKFQGFHRPYMLFVLDEMPGIHMAVITAIMNTCTYPEGNLVIGVGNPDSQVDALHQFSQLSKVRAIRISAYDHPNIVCGRIIIPGAVTQESIDFREKEYGKDSPFFNSRVRGIPPEEGTGSLIKGSWFDQCDINSPNFGLLQGDEEDSIREPIPFKDGPPAVGIDPSNSDNGDAACIVWGRGNRLVELQEFQCPNATHLAYNLIDDDDALDRQMYKNYHTSKLEQYGVEPKYIGVDVGGLGVSTLNAFHDRGIKCIGLQGRQLDDAILKGPDGELLYTFANLRAQMYWQLREDLRTGEIIIDISDKKIRTLLKKELLIIKFILKDGGKIAIEKKSDIQKRLGNSPNKADSCAYWNWMRLGHYSPKNIHLPFSGSTGGYSGRDSNSIMLDVDDEI